MGCSTSKIDGLPAVLLCRDRLTFLDEAIRHRYDLADAHIAYLLSLKSVGTSLQRFFAIGENLEFSPLNFPLGKKMDNPGALSSGSNSGGSHLHFHSDSENEDVSSGEQSPNSSLHDHHLHHIDIEDHGTLDSDGDFGTSVVRYNYMRTGTTPSVSYQQRPENPETGRIAESSNYGYPQNHYPSYYAGRQNHGGEMNLSNLTPSSASLPRPPPSPPQASSSTWDLLNFFDGDPIPYARDSDAARKEEGIPDLEVVDHPHGPVMETHETHKFEDDVDERTNKVEALYQTRPSVSVKEEEEMEYEMHKVNEEMINDKEMPAAPHVSAANSHQHHGAGSRGVSEIVREIQVQFERASESGNELTILLEAGKLPYRNSASNQVSSKLLSAVSTQPSALWKGKSTPTAFAGLGFDEEIEIRSKNISSTLQKCYLWEKKLYNEVKAEEKLRLNHEKLLRTLARLDENGAESSKIDSTRALIGSLSTKKHLAIQFVDKISVKINLLRNEELLPQIHQLIQGLSRMWRSMFECHHSQFQAIKEAKNLDAMLFHRKTSDDHVQATKELELDLINWTLNFSKWMRAHHGFIKSLNNWLLKCLLYEPEDTPDGRAPFSPSRIGAPPLFIICHQWCQVSETISEKKTIQSFYELAMSVLQVWNQIVTETRKRVTSKEMEREVKILEREDMKIQKGVLAMHKIVNESNVSVNVSLKTGLHHIFEAMEVLANSFNKAYEDLLRRSEEDRLLTQEDG